MQTQTLNETITRPTRARPTPQPAEASLRWLDITAHFTSTGGLVAGEDVAERMHKRWLSNGLVQPDTDPLHCLARWIAAGHVLSLESPWGRLLPMFQFDPVSGTPYPCVRRLLGVLRPVLDETDTALWFVTPNHWINDDYPAITMHQRLPQALMAARLDRHVAGGGGERQHA